MPAPRKGEFSLPEGLHYLNAAYMSPLPKRVEAAGVDGVRRKRDPSGISVADFFRESDRARTLFGAVIGAPADRIAIVPAVSYGMAIVTRNLRPPAGTRVVVAAEQFPSNVLPWHALAGERGLEVVAVAPPDAGADGQGAGSARGDAWNERILEAIDSRTSVVALGHIHWTDGTLFDLEAVGERAREVGAALVVDGTQSIGALPFALERVRPDAVVCAAYKWLLGPYGLGLAYFGARFDDAKPLEETWLGRAGSDDFQGLVRYRDEYRSGAERLDVGERSSFHLMPMLVAGLELVEAWRPAAIQEHCAALARPLVATARELGFIAEAEHRRASHLFGLRMPPGVAIEALRRGLDERRVIVSLRGSAVRISPHVYNDEADIAALEAALRASR